MLVVDDDPAVREVISEILDCAGFEVTATAGVQDGLGAMGRRSPDLVVTDFSLPDGTGRDILEGAMELPGRPPVIVMSGSIEVSAVPELLSAGAVSVLEKPFALLDLLAAVQAAAMQRSATQALPRRRVAAWT